MTTFDLPIEISPKSFIASNRIIRGFSENQKNLRNDTPKVLL